MRFVTFSPGSFPSVRGARPGVLAPAGTRVADLLAVKEGGAWGALPPPTPFLLDWFDRDGPWCAFAERVAHVMATDPTGTRQLDADGALRSLTEVRLLAPVPRPGKVVAVGLNYRDHAAEAKMPVPEAPVIFGKFPSAVIGPDAPVVLPASSDRVDYEAELAVVIGRRARGIARADALQAVLGFTNANDVSARDFQKADGQWVRAKSCDTFAPLGPAIVTLDELVRPDALGIELRLNGHTMQRSNTSEFIFDVPALVAFIADTITLEPGDVILTGTPAGVGFARRPPAYLRDGDSVEVEIDGLGVLRNPVVGSSTGREA